VRAWTLFLEMQTHELLDKIRRIPSFHESAFIYLSCITNKPAILLGNLTFKFFKTDSEIELQESELKLFLFLPRCNYNSILFLKATSILIMTNFHQDFRKLH